MTGDLLDRYCGRAIKDIRKELSLSNISQVLAAAGIDNSKHSKQPLRAALEIIGGDAREAMIKIAIKLNERKIDLSDSNFNSDEAIDLLEMVGNYQFDQCDCCEPIKPITRRSIYAKARSLFGTWNQFLECSGIDSRQVIKKIASRDPSVYLEDLFVRFEENNELTISDIRNTMSWNLRHERNQSCLILYNSDIDQWIVSERQWFFAAWCQFQAEKNGIDVISFYQDQKKLLWEQFKINHKSQEVWEDGRQELELRKCFADGVRVTRAELQKSAIKFHRTLLASTRSQKRRNDGKDHDNALRNAGFIPERLEEIYKEQDDKWNLTRCFQYAQNLMQAYIETGEPTLSREWCHNHEKEFHDALLRKVKGASWEKGLQWLGIDPIPFSITASHRAKRGLLFQQFFKRMLLENGFIEKDCDNGEPFLEKEFLAGKQLRGCTHQTRCHPDFVFADKIIDTKTGGGAITKQSDQLKRYVEHRKDVYLVTLRQGYSLKRIGEGHVITLSFDSFLEDSLGYIGVNISREKYNKELSQYLKAGIETH